MVGPRVEDGSLWTAKGNDRRAVLQLRGVEDLPAVAILEVADEVRRAVMRLGISDVRVDVASDEPRAEEA
jgi:hypothetical protein